MNRVTKGIPVLVVVVFMCLTPLMFGHLWVEVKIDCPVCESSQPMFTLYSYGNYIYTWRTVIHFYFYPERCLDNFLDCQNCGFASYLADAENIPASLLPDLREIFSKPIDPPGDANTSPEHMRDFFLRLEKTYKLIERDDRFWCDFYRLQGFHLGEVGLDAEATKAHSQALEYVNHCLDDSKLTNARKELLTIRGSLHRFLNDENAAIKDFKKALRMKYRNPDWGKQQLKYYNSHLRDILRTNLKALGVEVSPNLEERFRAFRYRHRASPIGYLLCFLVSCPVFLLLIAPTQKLRNVASKIPYLKVIAWLIITLLVPGLVFIFAYLILDSFIYQGFDYPISEAYSTGMLIITGFLQFILASTFLWMFLRLVMRRPIRHTLKSLNPLSFRVSGLTLFSLLIAPVVSGSFVIQNDHWLLRYVRSALEYLGY